MTKILYGISTIVLILGLQGCVSKQNIQINKNIKQLENKKLTYVTRKSNITVITPFTAIASGFFQIGSTSYTNIANLYNDSNGEFSISNYLSINLAKDMANKYKMSLNNQKNQNIIEYDIEDFNSKFTDSDYIIDNYTTDWRVMYYKFRFGKYYIVLRTKMRLIDVKTNEIVSEGYCQKETQYDKDHPLTFDLLFDNHAKGLIEETKKLSNSCLNQYKKLLNI